MTGLRAVLKLVVLFNSLHLSKKGCIFRRLSAAAFAQGKEFTLDRWN